MLKGLKELKELYELKEGQDVAFVYDGTLMTGVLWELRLLDCVIKSPSLTGLVSIGRGQIIKKVEEDKVISFLADKKNTDDKEYEKQVGEVIENYFNNRTS